jgi:hypothetical protein
MGFLDRWRRAADCLFPVGPGLDALTADMTKQGIVIITRNGAAYTVYWTRMPDERPARQGSVLKRSVEGAGATVLEALLDCRAQALKQREATQTTR